MQLIKKYKNRKYYNMNDSQYITQRDIIEYVKNGTPFKVISTVSNCDITDKIKVDIIRELTDRALTNRQWNKDQIDERLTKLTQMF